MSRIYLPWDDTTDVREQSISGTGSAGILPMTDEEKAAAKPKQQIGFAPPKRKSKRG